MFINSGMQRGLDFSKPESVDIDSIQEEFTTNYFSYLALTKAFLPFLLSKNTESGLLLYVHTAAYIWRNGVNVVVIAPRLGLR